MSLDPGLCASCGHARRVDSAKGSTFWRCSVHDLEPRVRKYPRLPVLNCQYHEPGERPVQ
jgi:hypothetical protein